MAKPKIRFNGYTEDWEQRKLGDMGSTFTGLSGKTKEDFGHGDAQFITYMNVFSNPVANLEMTEAVEIDAKQNNVKKGDVFFTTSSETPEEVGMSCVMPENKDNIYLNSFCFGYRPTEKFDLDYLAYVLRADSFRKEMKFLAQGISRYNISKNKVMEVSIPVPKLAEQTMIGRYFSSLDHLITLHQRKCEQTKTLKKYMLQKMFPQDGEKVPQIRFEGFTEDWEQRKLGKLYQRNTERNENLIGYDKTISVATMSYKDDGNGASESSLSTYKVLRVGDIAFEGHTNKQFRFGRFVVNDIGTGIMSPRFSTLRPLNEMPVNFWKQYIHSESVMRRILVNSTKAGTMMNELVIPEFLNQTIMVPSENEQAVIGQYFTNLDHLITLHQRKCDELKEVKKFMLQNIFV